MDILLPLAVALLVCLALLAVFWLFTISPAGRGLERRMREKEDRPPPRGRRLTPRT